MIDDLAILRGVAAAKRPITRKRLAEELRVDDDVELVQTFGRLLKEDQLQRTEMPAVGNQGTTYYYSLTTKGRAAIAAAGGRSASTQADNPGASPGVRASRAEAPEGNREKSSAASGTSAIRETAPPTRLGGEEGQGSVRRKHGADVAENRQQEQAMASYHTRAEAAQVSKILAAAADALSPAEIAQASQIEDEEAVRSALRDLKNEGAAHTEGTGRGTKWRGGPKVAKPAKPANRPAKGRTKPTRKAKVARRKSKKALVKVRKPYAKRVVRAAAAEAQALLGTRPHASGDALASGAPIAAFSSKGEIVLSGASGTKVLDISESREVIGLVRAFDKAGLLPESA